MTNNIFDGSELALAAYSIFNANTNNRGQSDLAPIYHEQSKFNNWRGACFLY